MAGARALWIANGMKREMFGKPIIGIANSFNPVVPIGWVNLLCATVLMYGLGRIHGKKEELEKERMLRE